MKVLPYARHWIDGADIASVVSALRSENITQGPRVAQFEDCVARYCGAPFAVAFSSGTAALHAAIFAAGIGPGDEVLTSALSFVASANCVLFQGATPRLVDVEPGGFNIDPNGVRSALSKRTKAVIPVDYAGHPAELHDIRQSAHRSGAIVIEDACHSLGAEYHGKKTGSHSDMTVFSFHPAKHITTGEGGMVLAHRKAYYDKLVAFRSHGIVRSDKNSQRMQFPWLYDMAALGYNYRLTDLQCALGISQMKKLDRFLRLRQKIASIYDAAFANLQYARPLTMKKWVLSARHLYVLRIDFAGLGRSRGEIMNALRERGVGTQVHYIPIHLHSYYRSRLGYKKGDFPEAEAFYESALSLPLFPKMTDGEVRRVIEAVTRVVG